MSYKQERESNDCVWKGNLPTHDCCASCKKRTYLADTWVCEIDKGEIFPKDKCPNYEPRF